MLSVVGKPKCKQWFASCCCRRPGDATVAITNTLCPANGAYYYYYYDDYYYYYYYYYYDYY